MENSTERKLELWDERSRANRMQVKADGKQWRKDFFLYLGVIASVIAFASILANQAG